ncbi:hypothetical protein PILCRDRAFT_825335 [Piloderma croceum F 1598]|uniref:Uncharacterized protein n=1 Tax=Piloderma croceum (strain F 1598) TaxID=765440 RepID=A0A0C3EYJ2_PILCF|nr:hypothetical protein PILCRDRAFT_825335 [Piloderma croceum F 1598]
MLQTLPPDSGRPNGAPHAHGFLICLSLINPNDFPSLYPSTYSDPPIGASSNGRMLTLKKSN